MKEKEIVERMRRAGIEEKEIKSILKAVNEGRETVESYDLRMSKMRALFSIGDTFEIINHAYYYGFTRGRRYEKGRKKYK